VVSSVAHLHRTVPLRAVELVDDDGILHPGHVEARKEEPFCVALPSLHSWLDALVTCLKLLSLRLDLSYLP
jgi:hypothetical protein